MTRSFKTWLALLALDVGSTLAVFNIISHYRGVTEHFILGPLATPVVLLVTAIYLIDGYRYRTNMARTDYTSLHLIAVLSAMVLTLLVTFVFFPAGFELQSSRGVIALSFITLVPATLGGRQMLHQQWIANRPALSLLFIGETASYESFRRECEHMGIRQSVLHSEIGLLPAALQELQAGAHPLEAIVFRESQWDLAPATAQALVELYFKGIPTARSHLAVSGGFPDRARAGVRTAQAGERHRTRVDRTGAGRPHHRRRRAGDLGGRPGSDLVRPKPHRPQPADLPPVQTAQHAPERWAG
jgi:hypothetical protein